MSVALTTERLRLRSWRDDDVDAFAAGCNTPAVTRHLGGLQTRAEIEAGVARIRQCEADHGHCFWAMERLSDAAMLGFCGLKRCDATGMAAEMVGAMEIGWRLREDAWGQGYAREAATATLAAAFDRFDADRVYAMTMAGNDASWGLMRRLGMAARPELDFDMAVHGPHVVYCLERSRWTA